MASAKSKKFWGWAGKAGLIAIPAAIAGFASYKKAQVEGEAHAKIAYETLQATVKDLSSRMDKLDARCPPFEGVKVSPKARADLPEKFEDAVQQFREEK